MANEKRLIWDVDMKSAFNEWIDHDDYRTMYEVIDDVPTADAVALPCKIGDSLWCVYSPPHNANLADKGKWYVDLYEVARFHYGVKGLSIEMHGFGTVSVKEIGKTVFLSLEEAEKALAKFDGDWNG